MDKILSLFLTVGYTTMFFDGWSQDFDIIGSVPFEVAVIILRKLDGKSLLTAAQVSSRWLGIIKSDRTLRRTVREELARQRHEKRKRHMDMSESANINLHMAALQPTAKKQRRTFEKSVKVSTKPTQPKKNWASSTTTQLRKFR